MTPQTIEGMIEAAGLAVRGVLRLDPDEQVGPLLGIDHLVLIGTVGRRGWEAFAGSSEAKDGLADPLDRWSQRIVAELARQCGAKPLFPFQGPPHWPFQRWAQRAEPLHRSPLGLLIHPRYGLWHSYRGALAFAHQATAAPPAATLDPCASCVDRPCLRACPVSAFSDAGYDVEACAAWLRSEAGANCMEQGCLARRACPIGAAFAHAPDQAGFGMRAFLAAR